MNNRIFISGKVTGDPSYPFKFESAVIQVSRPNFFDRHGYKAAQQFGRFGFKPVSPVDLTIFDIPLGMWPYWLCMVVCLFHLLGCSYVYFLHDWQESRGARIEHKVVVFFRKNIIYQINN